MRLTLRFRVDRSLSDFFTTPLRAQAINESVVILEYLSTTIPTIDDRFFLLKDPTYARGARAPTS
jgi:hypothetical protein